jgi:hypothetical protein
LPGYAASQRNRKRIEPFGWGRTIGGLARPMLRGVEKLGFKFTLTMAGYNLIRLPNSSRPKHERQPHIGNSEPINNIQLRPLSRSQKPDTVAKSRISAAC